MATVKTTFDVTDENFQEKVLGSEKAVLLDYWAEWCPPCRMIAPLVDELGKRYQDTLVIGKVDVDAYPALSEIYDVWGFPTLVLIQNGQPVHRIVGFKTLDRLEAELIPFLTEKANQ